MDPYILNIITQEVSDRLTTQVTQEIHNKFDNLVAMRSPSTENCSQTGFQLGRSLATDNTPAASMVSPAIVETMASLTDTVVDTVTPSTLIPDKGIANRLAVSHLEFSTLLNNLQDTGFKFQLHTYSTGPELSIVPKITNVQLTIG
ncbi:hypothetical protein CHS0354_032097 [Potamilus streckersoni]|uniref:Uncharacterized protein n=1 Tax=Potamilus streckersoni TaxID=2493646 RepID=A0AAE0WHN2_9BIVA|nr:hypothetical protein CHS0354_032097 [Potamilus streckersoni]